MGDVKKRLRERFTGGPEEVVGQEGSTCQKGKVKREKEGGKGKTRTCSFFSSASLNTAA